MRLLLAALLLAAPQALAHAVLIDSTPAPQASLPAGPLAITLRYNSRIDAARSRLSLKHADGTVETLAQDPPGAPNVLRAHLAVAAGAYVIRWQVLATDGHITRGNVPFVAK